MLMLVILWGLAACGGNQNDPSESTEGTSAPVTASPTPTPSPTLTPTPTPDLHEGEKRSYLTGEWIPEEEAEQRPYAVILNMLSQSSVPEDALPHPGLSDKRSRCLPRP